MELVAATCNGQKIFRLIQDTGERQTPVCEALWDGNVKTVNGGQMKLYSWDVYFKEEFIRARKYILPDMNCCQSLGKSAGPDELLPSFQSG